MLATNEIFIYLRVSPELCMTRINKRNRECESNITIEYITQLYELYEDCIQKLIKKIKKF